MSTDQRFFLSYDKRISNSQIKQVEQWLDEATQELVYQSAAVENVSNGSNNGKSHARLFSQIGSARIFIQLAEDLNELSLEALSIANRLNKPIIIIQLMSNEGLDAPEFSGLLCLGIPPKKNVLIHALQFWPKEHDAYWRKGMHRPHYYPEMILSNL